MKEKNEEQSENEKVSSNEEEIKSEELQIKESETEEKEPASTDSDREPKEDNKKARLDQSGQTKNNLKTFGLYFLIALFVGSFTGGGVYLWQKQSTPKTDNTEAVEETNESEKVAEEPKETAKEAEEETIVYTTALPGLNFRKKASLTADILKELPFRTKMKVEKEEGDWYYGSDEEGGKGYFAKTYTSKTDPVKSWLDYSGDDYNASYPSTWVTKACEDFYIGFGPDTESLQACASEKGAMVDIVKVEQAETAHITSVKSTLDSFTETSVTVDGITATRISGATIAAELGPVAGSSSITVVLTSGTQVYHISYLQAPGGIGYESVFDTIVSTIDFS